MNPILQSVVNPADAIPLVELKQQAVVFVSGPPGPASAGRVFDLFRTHFGDTFGIFRSTFFGAFLRPWNAEAKRRFVSTLLPELRCRTTWGYSFQESKPVDARLFMFHGFRPYQEPDQASFYRFEFEWDLRPEKLRAFFDALMDALPVISAYGGYFFQGRPNDNYAILSYKRIFALSKRYWCPEVVNIELTAEQMKNGYKCVNWITAIGPEIGERAPASIEAARRVAFDYSRINDVDVFQAGEAPVLGDRNRFEDIRQYVALAHALLPLQITEHEPFGGFIWNAQNTMAWMRRFTHPHDM